MRAVTQSTSPHRRVILREIAKELLGSRAMTLCLIANIIDSFISHYQKYGKNLIWPPRYNYTINPPTTTTASRQSQYQTELPMLVTISASTQPKLYDIPDCPYCIAIECPKKKCDCDSYRIE